MSFKSAIYTADQRPYETNLTAAQPTAQLELGTVVRRFGTDAQLSGNGILLSSTGYYDVSASVTATPAAAGDYTASVYVDGVAVPGASQTVTATAGATVALSVPCLVRLQCCGSSATLTVVLSTSAALPAEVTVNNVGVVVERV